MRNLLILKGTFCGKNGECKKSAQQHGNKEVEGETRWQIAERKAGKDGKVWRGLRLINTTDVNI